MSIIKKQEGHFVIHSLGNPSIDCYIHPDGEMTFDFAHIIDVWRQKMWIFYCLI